MLHSGFILFFLIILIYRIGSISICETAFPADLPFFPQTVTGGLRRQGDSKFNLKESKYKTIHFLCLLVRNLIFTPPLHDSFCLSFLNLNTANFPLAPGCSWWFRKSAAIKNAALSVSSKISAAEFLTVCVHSTCVWVNPEGGHGAVSVH